MRMMLSSPGSNSHGDVQPAWRRQEESHSITCCDDDDVDDNDDGHDDDDDDDDYDYDAMVMMMVRMMMMMMMASRIVMMTVMMRLKTRSKGNDRNTFALLVTNKRDHICQISVATLVITDEPLSHYQ